MASLVLSTFSVVDMVVAVKVVRCLYSAILVCMSVGVAEQSGEMRGASRINQARSVRSPSHNCRIL